jgi:hypothetical protein
MKSLLSLIYAQRALAILEFLLAPKNTTNMLVFAAVMGFTFLSTAPRWRICRSSSTGLRQRCSRYESGCSLWAQLRRTASMPGVTSLP